MIYGYSRVSIDGQSVAAQVCQLRAVGAGHVFHGTARGAKPDRAQIRPVLNTLAAIADRKAGFRWLGDTWVDTMTDYGRPTLAMLGGPAAFEPWLIRARTSKGRARAVARGVKLDPNPKLIPYQMKEAIRRRDQREETLREIARSYNVRHSTISRLAI